MRSLDDALRSVDVFIQDLISILGRHNYLVDIALDTKSELMMITKGVQLGGNKKTITLAALRYSFKRLKINRLRLIPNADIIAFINSNSQASVVAPTLLSLIKSGKSVVVLTTKENIVELIRAKGIETHYIMGLLPKARDYKLIRTISLSNTREKQRLLDFLVSSIPKYSFLMQKFDFYLNRVSPKYAIIGNDLTMEGSLFFRLCERENIKTGGIQHGSMDRTNPRNGEIKVDDLFVYGNKTRLELEAIGINLEKINVTGKPNAKLESNAKKNNPIKVILIANSGIGVLCSEKHHVKIIRSIISLACETPNVNWIFKLHPKDSKRYYKNTADNIEVLNNDDLIERALSNDNLIEKCDLVISGGSTFTLDAVLKGKHVVTLDLLDEFSAVSFVKDRLTTYVDSIDKLKIVVCGLLRKEDPLTVSKSAVEHYFFQVTNPAYSAQHQIAKAIINKI